MNTDRELLESAAKAAGWVDFDWLSEDGRLNVYEPNGRHSSFDPLNDDGDALWLAVKLRLSVSVDQWEVSVWKTGSGHDELVETATMGYPIEEATRRCIVRVAAELAKVVQP